MLVYAASVTERWRPRTRADWTAVALNGLLVIGAYNAFLFVGQEGVTSAIAAILVALNPILATAVSHIALGSVLVQRVGDNMSGEDATAWACLVGAVIRSCVIIFNTGSQYRRFRGLKRPIRDSIASSGQARLPGRRSLPLVQSHARPYECGSGNWSDHAESRPLCYFTIYRYLYL